MQRVNPERDDLDTVINEAIQCEKACDERVSILRNEKEPRSEASGSRKPKREWTWFKNRSGGTAHYKPREASRTGNKPDKIWANTVSLTNQGSSRDKPQQGYKNNKQYTKDDKKLSRKQMDTLRAEGKCFNCREAGHKQRNCPRLQSMKPPKMAIKVGVIGFASLEKLAEMSEESDVWVGSMSIVRKDLIVEELAELEEIEFGAHRLCKEAWGEDPLWYQEETQFECIYSVCASNKEVNICNRVIGEIRTITIDKISNPAFNIMDAFKTPETNRNPGSVQEGGFTVIDGYNKWEWPAINWMTARLRGQLLSVDRHNALEGVKDKDRIDVQPTMFSYSVKLDELDIIYNISHEEVLDELFSPEWIIDQMIMAWKVPADNRGDRFTDKRMSMYVTIMLGMTTIPGQKEKIKKRRNKKDWVMKLLAIEFAMNSARSSTTGFTPFYLNYGRNPSPMIWKGEEVYPGVKQFTENRKDTIMSAHDAIIASRIQSTIQANKK